MARAAEAGALYHLWWHPENFGAFLDENLAFLERILDHFEWLQRRVGMQSMTMTEAAAGV